jgi:hypothetical protein
MSGKRTIRHSDAGREASADKKGRNSRAGQDSHAVGHHVRHVARPEEHADAEDKPARTSPNITLPTLRFLQRKKVAGEWI